MTNNNDSYPEQFSEYQNILNQMMALHKQKSEDYSPWNVKGVGEVGVAVRIWDKTARLMNLLGWDIGTGKISKSKSPKNESIEDTLLDLASYAIILLIVLRGKWGK
jgi:hypothetical protein